MRFRIDSAPVPGRRFRLPAGERATAPALPELDKPAASQSYKRDLLEAQRPVETHKRTPQRPVQAQADGRGAHTVYAPVGPRQGRTVLDFTAASARPMPAFLGQIQLRITPEACDLERLELGLLSLAVDHDVSRLAGRIVEGTIHGGYAGRAARLDMKAEVASTATGDDTLAEIDDLTRQGFSPGFLIDETEVIDPDDPDYDERQMFQIRVTKWMPFEISSTAVPRSIDARLKGVAAMGNVLAMDDVITGAPEIVHREDMIGLSLSAGRVALRSGQGSKVQREKLEEFFKAYETGLENGLSRDAAATAAKLVAGI